ncbi:MAG: glycosyltransferase family 25 protein [Pseudomonadota bacterium]
MLNDSTSVKPPASAATGATAVSMQIITLSPDGERTQALLAELAGQGLEASTYAAVDGRNGLPALEAPERLDEARALRYRQVPLTGSEIGCYLSHYRVIRDAYRAGEQQLCVLEDDVSLEPEFAEVLGGLLACSDPKFEFVRFMGLKRHRRKRVQQLPEERWLTRPVKGLCGTQGYLINRGGMEKVLRTGAAIWRPIDKFYDQFWDSDLACFAIEPHVIYELPSQSSIRHSSTGKVGSLWQRTLGKRLLKVWRSSQRRLYQFRRWSEFRPAEAVGERYGRTERIH